VTTHITLSKFNCIE